VAEESLNNYQIQLAEMAVIFIKKGFLLVKKLIILIEILQAKLKSKQNVFNMPNWDNYKQT